MFVIDATAFFLLGALTIIISVLSGRSTENHRFRNLFYVLGLASLACVLFTAYRNYQTQEEAKQAQEKLNTNLTEITRIQNLNTELQKQLIKSNAAVVDLSKENRDLSKQNIDLSQQNVDLSKQNVALAKQSVEELTGGDSICYVGMFGLGNSDVIQVGLFGKGRNPVSGVTIRIADLDVSDHLVKSGQLTLENLGKGDKNFSFPTPTRYSGFFKPLYSFTPPADQLYRRFNVFINARNGAVTQLIRLRRVNKSWTVATRVTASFYDKRSGIVHEEIAKGFPQETLRDDGDWKATDKLKRLKIQE